MLNKIKLLLIKYKPIFIPIIKFLKAFYRAFKQLIWLIIFIAVLLHLPFNIGVLCFASSKFDIIFSIICGYEMSTLLFNLAKRKKH